MLKAIKRFFGNKDQFGWNSDRSALAEVPVGAKIIDNGGLTGGWASVEWMKNSDGTWANGVPGNEITNVNDDYFQMPFLVVDAAPVLVSI